MYGAIAPLGAGALPAATGQLNQPASTAGLALAERAAAAVAATESSPSGSVTTARPGTRPIAAEYSTAVDWMAVDAHQATRPEQFVAMHRPDGPGWLSSDGTKSVRLPDGRVLWAYGDTLIGTARGGQVERLDGFLRNSLVVQDGRKRTTIFKRDAAGKPHASIVSPHPGEWYWTGQPIVERDTIKIMAGRVKKTRGEHGWNFAGAGTDIVTLNADDLSLRSIDPMSRSGGTSWGANAFRDGDYVYFTGNRDDPEWAPAMLLARAPEGQVNSRHMQFWNGSRWVSSGSEARPITHGTEGSFHRVNGGYALVTQGYPFGTDIFVQNAPRLTGPWSEPRRIASLPKLPPKSITYGAKTHPAFSEGGAILLSYNVNRSDAGMPGDLSEYRPGFISIPRWRITAPENR